MSLRLVCREMVDMGLEDHSASGSPHPLVFAVLAVSGVRKTLHALLRQASDPQVRAGEGRPQNLRATQAPVNGLANTDL